MKALAVVLTVPLFGCSDVAGPDPPQSVAAEPVAGPEGGDSVFGITHLSTKILPNAIFNNRPTATVRFRLANLSDEPLGVWGVNGATPEVRLAVRKPGGPWVERESRSGECLTGLGYGKLFPGQCAEPQVFVPALEVEFRVGWSIYRDAGGPPASWSGRETYWTEPMWIPDERR